MRRNRAHNHSVGRADFLALASHAASTVAQMRHRKINPFRNAVPFWGRTTQILSSLPPKRDCASKGVKLAWRGKAKREPYAMGDETPKKKQLAERVVFLQPVRPRNEVLLLLQYEYSVGSFFCDLR